MTSIRTVEDLHVFQLSMKLGDQVWVIVERWQPFAKFGLGVQLTSSVDSIAANISEGYGRYSFKENQRFCYYARGSLQETKTWLLKASNRDLIEADKVASLLTMCENINRMLNGYIRSIGRRAPP